MRLAVLADLHGNLPALEAVVADLQQRGPDGILLAGDFVTGGPNPIETMQLIRSLEVHAIRGNTDDRLLAFHAGQVPDAWRESEQWASLRWLERRLDVETLGWIASLPLQRVISFPGTAPIRVVHGSLSSPSGHIAPERDLEARRFYERDGLVLPGRNSTWAGASLAQIKETVLACGHSHIAWSQEQDGRLAFNPGSVGAPTNDDVRAQYALLTWQGGRWQVERRAVPYDIERVRRAYEENGLLAQGGAVARAFLMSIETGQAILGRFVAHVFRLAAEAEFEEGGLVPDHVWERAVQTFFPPRP